MEFHARQAIFFPCLFMVSGLLWGAPIDSQTPTPNSSLISDYTLSRQQCVSTQNIGNQCISLNLSYPAATSSIDDYIRGVLIYRLSGQVNSAYTLMQAVEYFLNTQTIRLKRHEGNGGEFDFSWQLLGQGNGLVVLSEDVLQRETSSEDRLLRQFTVLDTGTYKPLELADILVSGQGEVLASLQVQGLLSLFMQYGQMNQVDAQAAITTLPSKYSENWAVSQDALVFGYEPILLGGQVLLPLILLPTSELEGIIRPDILTAARSWPVNVPKQIQQNR